MSNVQIEIVSVDDWEGLYIEGELQFENHRINTGHLFDALNESGHFDGVDFIRTGLDGTPLEERMIENGEGFPKQRPKEFK